MPVHHSLTCGRAFARRSCFSPRGPNEKLDSLQTAPRVAGVRVAAFPITGGEPGSFTLGAEVAATTTGADGMFTLPSVPGGLYAVTFTPSAGSIYVGVWSWGTIHEQSSLFPWWVVLPKK
jgi:hypothetical protein